MIIQVKGDVVKLKGTLLENYWLALKSAVSLLLKQHPSGVIIDGSELTEINDVGAQTFLDASNYIQAQRARVVVSGLPEHILVEIRQIPGVRSQLPLASSIEEARASLEVGDTALVPEARRRPSVLVPTVGNWQRAIDYAVAQAGERKAEIHLLYVFQVPRAMPLGVPLPEKEHEAERVLSEGEGMLKRSGVTVRRLTTRSRTALEGVWRFAAEARPELVVTAFDKEEVLREHSLYRTVDALCKDSASELAIFCTGTLGDAPQPECRNAILVPLIGAWPSAVDFAAAQAGAGKSEIHLLYVIQVPRSLAIDAPLADSEKDAQMALSEAENSLKRSGIAVKRFTARSRGLFEGIGRYAAETHPALVVLSYFSNDLQDEDSRYAGMATICQESPCDMALICQVR